MHTYILKNFARMISAPKPSDLKGRIDVESNEFLV